MARAAFFEQSHPTPAPLTVRWRQNARARRIILRLDARDDAVIITLPPGGNRKAGLALLDRYQDWARAELAARAGAGAFAPGASVPIGDIPHPIRHVLHGRGGAWIEAGAIHVAGDAAFLPRRVVDLLRAEAARRLTPIVRHKATLAGVQPGRITYRDTASRWGSCSSAGALMLSWRLVMTPDFVQDYVVAHEVAHLRHMNHAPAFWRFVGQLTAHRDAATNWLKQHGGQIMRVGATQS